MAEEITGLVQGLIFDLSNKVMNWINKNEHEHTEEYPVAVKPDLSGFVYHIFNQFTSINSRNEL